MSSSRKFHPWEGGEGKITSQFIINHLLRAWQHIQQQRPQQAEELLLCALHYPDNLSEGRLPGQTDNDIWFWLGICARQQGGKSAPLSAFRRPRWVTGASIFTATTTISQWITSSGKVLPCG